MSRLSFVLAALHVYIAARLLPDLPGGAAAVAIGAVALIASLYLIPIGFAARRTGAPDAGGVTLVALIAMGASRRCSS